MSSLADVDTHVREVLNVVNNPLAARRAGDSVAQSWLRCLTEFKLDPARFVMPPVLTQRELGERREAAGDCGQQERQTEGRSGNLSGDDSRLYVKAGADRGANAQAGQRNGSQPPLQPVAVVHLADQLLDEVQRALSFFWTGSTEEQINAVYLSGGSAHLSGLVAAMGERLQLPVMFSDPFRSLSISRQVDEQFLQEHASALAVSVGLATRRPGDK